jgi:hypothetical protein
MGVTLLSRFVTRTQTKGGSFVTVVLPIGTKGSSTSYYKRIASSTQSDVMCRWDGEEATREARGHEFDSPHRSRVKNRVTCDLRRARVWGPPGDFFSSFFLTLACPPLVLVPSPGTKGPPLLSLIISLGWTWGTYTPYQSGLACTLFSPTSPFVSHHQSWLDFRDIYPLPTV